MTIQECYTALGGNYDEVLSRLSMERLVSKFVLKFVEDGSYQLLEESLASGNTEEAFRAAHTLKGMCLNLAFTRLATSSSNLTEALRGGDLEQGKALFPQVAADYKTTVDAINTYKAGLS